MRVFDINYDVLLKLLVPKVIRQPVLIRWLQSLTAPVRHLYDRFTKYRISTAYYLSHNSQVVYLQAVLNDRYDPGLRRVRVTDGPFIDPQFIYKKVENKPLYLYKNSENQPRHIHTNGETVNAPGSIDFFIEMPSFITYDEKELKALVDKYRSRGKYNYQVKPV